MERPPSRPPAADGAGGGTARRLVPGRARQQRRHHHAARRRPPRLRPTGTAVAGGPISAIRLPGPCVRALPEGWSFGAANVRNGWSKLTLDHDRVGKPALVIRLTATCDTTGAIPDTARPAGDSTLRTDRTRPGRAADQLAHRVPRRLRHHRAEIDGDGDASLIDEASSAIGFTSRHDLQQALEQRSNGRLHLDPDEAQ